MTRRAIDVPTFHIALWLRSAPQRTVRVVKSQMADEMQVSRFTMHKVLDRMVAEGRLTPISASDSYPLFRVADPAGWDDDES